MLFLLWIQSIYRGEFYSHNESSRLFSFVIFGGYVASSLPYFSMSFFNKLQLSHFFLFAPENALEINQTTSLKF
jgi:hypothetical protein